MPDLLQITGTWDAIILPMLGLATLFLSKVCDGELARRSEQQFLLTLVVITVVTLRTVIHCDDTWLLHMLTLAMMILGALMVPNQNTSVAPLLLLGEVAVSAAGEVHDGKQRHNANSIKPAPPGPESPSSPAARSCSF